MNCLYNINTNVNRQIENCYMVCDRGQDNIKFRAIAITRSQTPYTVEREGRGMLKQYLFGGLRVRLIDWRSPLQCYRVVPKFSHPEYRHE